MTELPATLAAHGHNGLKQALLAELSALPPDQLPLHQAVNSGGFVGTDTLDLTLLAVDETADSLHIRSGIFFTEIVINCGCGDDPMPIPGYCELQITIDRRDATARFSLVG